jgi:S1-C subfamily serine protease
VTEPATSVTTQQPRSSSLDITAIVDTVEPSIVGLSVNGAQGWATGSGVIASTAGDECYVLTDSGLFSGPSSQLQVASSWGDVENGYLVGMDPSSGIAVVKVTFKGVSAADVANPGSVASIQTGQVVVSVGSSSIAGSSNTPYFAFGYVSDTSSYLPPVDGASDAMYAMLVADMSVLSSSYGGALVDGSGQVIGITNPAPGGTAQAGLIYVTPIDTAMADVTWMIKNGQAVPHPWLGILQATDVAGPGAQRFGVPGAVEVDTVASGSPAAKAGIADNDVVTSIDGHNISSVGALIAWMASARPGQVMNIAWAHNGHRHKAGITLGTQPATATPS